MNKSELIKKIEKFFDDTLVTVLIDDGTGRPYITDLEDVKSTKGKDGEVEILLVPVVPELE